MKILRIRVDGLQRYKKPFEVSFYAAQRVENSHLDAVYHLFDNIYVNTAEAFVGINASGKTTALQVISFCGLLLSAVPLNREYVPPILKENTPTVFDIDFYADNAIYHLQSILVQSRDAQEGLRTTIIEETLWKKNATSKINKQNLLNYGGLAPIRVRGNDEYLPDDVSIMIAVNRKIDSKAVFVDLAGMTNWNLFIPGDGSISEKIISLLDPTIEYISVAHIHGKFTAKIKFYQYDEITIYNPSEFNIYLSSGTVKGINVYQKAIMVLKRGGYLLIDEIENHFNRELVVALIRLFMDKQTNPKGAVILFSTHYPELLDELARNDSVFITRSENGLTVDNLNSLMKRNDIRRSEIYQSNFLGGTAPKYDALYALKKSIICNVREMHED